MRISDWSSDVCSSDLTFMQSLLALRAGALALACVLAPVAHAADTANLLTGIPRLACEATLCLSSSLRPGQCGPSLDHYLDRKSVVEGKSVSERVDHGGRRIIKKKNNYMNNIQL